MFQSHKSALSATGALLALLSVPLAAHASVQACPSTVYGTDTVTLASYEFNVAADDSQTIELCRPMYVQKLYIRAEAGYGDAYAQVVVNGDVKGTLYVPGSDPHYVVTVDDVTSEITLSVSRGYLSVDGISAVMSEAQPAPGYDVPPAQLPSYHQAVMATISDRCLWLVNELEGYSDYADYGKYLLPIRKAASEALAMADARGDTSATARPYYLALLKTLDDAQSYLTHTFEMSTVEGLAVELMSKRETIRAILQ